MARGFGIGVSAFLSISSIILFITPGLNYGVDFKGGIQVEVKTSGPADLAAFRSGLGNLGLGEVALQEFGSNDRLLIRLERQAGPETRQTEAVEKVRSEIRLDPEQTKGQHGRVVFVSEKLLRELAAYVKAVPCKSLQDKLFYTQKRPGEGFSANTLTQFFHYLFKNAGIEGASSHSPRRTFITNLAEKGVVVRVLMSLAGHRNITTTQVYIDVNDAMKRKAVELI